MKLQEVVDREPEDAPYSDDDLVDELAKQGITVARRHGDEIPQGDEHSRAPGSGVTGTLPAGEARRRCPAGGRMSCRRAGLWFFTARS